MVSNLQYFIAFIIIIIAIAIVSLLSTPQSLNQPSLQTTTTVPQLTELQCLDLLAEYDLSVKSMTLESTENQGRVWKIARVVEGTLEKPVLKELKISFIDNTLEKCTLEVRSSLLQYPDNIYSCENNLVSAIATKIQTLDTHTLIAFIENINNLPKTTIHIVNPMFIDTISDLTNTMNGKISTYNCS